MKKQLIPILIFLIIFNLSGCGDTSVSDTSGDDKLLLQAIDLLSKANSYELTESRVESTTFGDKQSIFKIITEKKIMSEPFVRWSRTDKTNTNFNLGGQRRSLGESYQVLNDGQLDVYVRFSPTEDAAIGKEPVLGEWEKNPTYTKEQDALTLDAMRSNFDAQLYLLSSNIDTFKKVENDEVKDENILKYDGYIEQTTIMEAYQKYIRDFYVQVNLLPDSKNLSLEDLRNEITDGDLFEIKVGIPKLAYSEEPVPVSLWIDIRTFELIKVAVDETLVLQSYMEKEMPKVNPDLEKPIVSEALLTYEIKSIDNLKGIPIPLTLPEVYTSTLEKYAEKLEAQILTVLTNQDLEVSHSINGKKLTIEASFIYDGNQDIYNRLVSIVNKGRVDGIDNAYRDAIKEIRSELKDDTINILLNFKISDKDAPFYGLDFNEYWDKKGIGD